MLWATEPRGGRDLTASRSSSRPVAKEPVCIADARAAGPIVYLDTSDWSRFGDVLRGRGEAEDRALYNELAGLADAGAATFAFSMPIMAELLQYDPAHHETSHAKAEAVERLCGRTAFLWPGRLIALEIANALAARDGHPRPTTCALSRDGDWFPSFADAFADLRESNERLVAETIAKADHMNRATRRKVAARARNIRMAQITAEVVPEFAKLYGLAETDVRNSIGAVLDGRIPPEEGSRRLFRALAWPTAFLETYYVRYSGDKDLRTWLSSTGMKLAEGIERSRSQLTELPIDKEARELLDREVRRMADEVGASLVKLGADDMAEHGLSRTDVERVIADPSLLATIPSFDVLSSYLPRFMSSNLGIDGDRRGYRPERSSAGDMVHAFYLPHSDVWRGDRRFAHLLRTEVLHIESRIATRLADIPGMVEAWHRVEPADLKAWGARRHFLITVTHKRPLG